MTAPGGGENCGRRKEWFANPEHLGGTSLGVYSAQTINAIETEKYDRGLARFAEKIRAAF